jgi:uncharacterized protein YbaR (Trm112 family)
MHVALTCRACDHAWDVVDEPRDLVTLCCPSCAGTALPQAAEDFASALEDALVQLHHLGQTHTLRIEFGTATLPPAFAPKAPPDDGVGD